MLEDVVYLYGCIHTDYLNPHHMLRKEVFTDQNYLILLISYGNFLNLVYSGRTIKEKLEAKKTTEEDYFHM